MNRPVIGGHPHDGYAYEGCVCVCCLNVRALAAPPPEAGLREALAEAARLIETGENRAMAADGPVPHFRGELDDREWRQLWVALAKVRAALEAQSE